MRLTAVLLLILLVLGVSQRATVSTLATKGTSGLAPAQPNHTEISLAAALQMMTFPNVVVIDTRPSPVYGEGHLPDAIQVSSGTGLPPEATAALRRARNVIVYGSGQDTARCRVLATQLAATTAKPVFFYVGGYSEWAAAGLPGIFPPRHER